MKISHALFALTLLGASAGAMAEDGAARVDKQMNDLRAVAMQQYDATHDGSQVAHQDPHAQQQHPDKSAQIENQPG
jgi:outer membrane lipoprotein-sorting protein